MQNLLYLWNFSFATAKENKIYKKSVYGKG